MITGTFNVLMDVEKANYYNSLADRDEAKAIVEISASEGDTKYNKCPSCNMYVYRNQKFCKECGQRLDWENIAL